jgi:hypothetical protein
LICGYPQHVWNEKLLVMIQAFIDDSASNTGDRRLYLAGYVNFADSWIAFANEWERVLRMPPSIKYFRMVEANSLRGEFEGWKDGDRDRKVWKLAETIYRHAPWSIECSVSQNDHDRIVKPAAPYGLGNPYSSCFYGIIISLARFHAANNLSIPVDFIFDQHSALEGEAHLFYEYHKSLQLPEVKAVLGSTPIFRDDKQVLPIQAADMLAWHLRREAEGNDPPGSRPALDLLRGNGRHVIVNFTPEILETMAAKMRDIPGVSGVQRKSDWQKFKKESVRLSALGFTPDDFLRLLPKENFVKGALKRLARFVRL